MDFCTKIYEHQKRVLNSTTYNIIMLNDSRLCDDIQFYVREEKKKEKILCQCKQFKNCNKKANQYSQKSQPKTFALVQKKA